MADWVYETARAEIGNAKAEISHSDSGASANEWTWTVTYPGMIAQGSCQSFELAQERATKIATFFNKEM